MAQTQSMFDFPKKIIERVKAIDPAQPTIDLKFDNKLVILDIIYTILLFGFCTILL